MTDFNYKDLSSEILAIILSIVLNGVYVAAEFSLARCRPSKVESMAVTGGFLHQLLLQALNRLNDYISAAQVGITIASLVLGASAEPFFSRLLDPFFKAASVPDFLVDPISFAFAMTFATYLHVVIGEFIPKTLALQYPEQIALATILPLDWSYRITKPLVWILNSSANSFLKGLGIPANNKVVLAYSEEEIKLLVRESQKEGVIERTEEEMVNKVFEFTDTVVREVMTPRTEIVGLEASSSISRSIEAAITNKVSRLPVYEENVDQVTGLVLTIDLFQAFQNGRGDSSIKEIIRPIMRVPESKPIADLLTEFKKNRVQIAIVLDEFGGTAGLVTLEDIVEELVGDIQDEDETAEEIIQRISEKEYLIEARVLITEVNEELGSNFSDEHYDTIGGFVFGLLGREGKVGDEIKYENWVFKVEKIERKIEQIRVIELETVSELESSNEAEQSNLEVSQKANNGNSQ
jgi:CBS domain containing-hemolysin-like protein